MNSSAKNIVFGLVVAAVLLPADLQGQVRLARPAFGVGVLDEIRPVLADDLSDDSDLQTVEGAVLKTDPDLEALLEKANRHAEEENWRVATRLWQAVLERSGDALYSDDERNYFSISEQVEQVLAALPPEALSIYRVTADASAKQIMTEAGDPNDIAALMRVTGNFFVSSQGDDAAFRLGCLYLDRYDFSSALRLFEKVATQHPDPSVPLDEVYARMAICHAFMGDADLAAEALGAGRKVGKDSAAIDTVARSVESLELAVPASGSAMESWLTIHGNEKRMAAMPALPASAYNVDQVAAWQFYVLPRDERYIKRPETVGKLLVGESSYGPMAAESRNAVERRVIKAWAANGWRPSGHLLFNDDSVVFKAPADVVVIDRKKVGAVAVADSAADLDGAEIKDFAVWRSLWRNVFEVDTTTMRLDQLMSNNARIRFRRGVVQQPVVNDKVQLGVFPRTLFFEDLIHSQMAIHENVLYTIEGKSFDNFSSHSPPSQNMGHGWNVVFRRTRSNFLTAYELDSGRVLWRLPRVNKPGSPSWNPATSNEDDEDSERWLTSGGMMGAPVQFADLLIVPVNQNGAIHLYGIDPQREGETVWSAFLCDEPESGSDALAPVNLTIEGSDLFATCGTGVLFVLDPTTGKIRYARRYARAGAPDEMLKQSFNSTYTRFDGWSGDTILVNGRELICLCSDTNSIRAYDRNDGSFIWKTGLRPYGVKVDYIIGKLGNRLYLGGKKTIIAIDLNKEGCIAWGGEPLFDGAVTTGRGMVTPDGVFVPVGNGIWRFSLDGENGRPQLLNQVEAFLGTESPVGNLYSDGDRIWVRGASRVYALSPKEDES